MNKRNQILYCDMCKNLVEIVCPGDGTLTCCGQAMTALNENTTDASVEKHVPAVVDMGDHIEVTVGSVEHPMTEEHLINFIEVLTEKGVCRKYLKPGEKPVATFPAKMADVLAVREYCNLHKLWKK